MSEGNGTSDAWPTPVSLEHNTLPAFPVDALPACVGDYVQAVADETQTPTDLGGCLALAVLATAAQRRYVVQIRPGYTEPLALWMLPLMDSAERKSTVFKRFRAPIHERQAELINAGAANRGRALAELKSAEGRLAKATKDASSKHGSEATQAACERDEAVDEVERLQRDIPPQALLLVDDITPEKFGMILAEVGAVTIASAEGGVFSTFGGRYNKQVANLDLLLKSHAGDPAIVDRVGRDRLVIEDPACTFAMAVQPDVLAEVSKRSEWSERGGMARFLYAIPTPRVGTRTGIGTSTPPNIEDTYRKRMLELLPQHPPVVKADRPAKPIVMHLSPEARALWEAFEAELEPRMRSETGDLAWCKAWAGKFAGALARIAALLQLAERGPGSINLQSMQRALSLAPYFEAHARAALGMAGVSEEISDAREILTWLRGKRCAEFNEREVYRARPHLDPERVTAACDELCARHWIAELEAPEIVNSKGGRKPSPRWETHPALHASSVSSVSSVIGVHKQPFEPNSLSISIPEPNAILHQPSAVDEPLWWPLTETDTPEITDTTDRTPDLGDPDRHDYYASNPDIGATE